MIYYTYIVQCSDNSYYTGIAANLEKRIKEHNGLLKGGAIYTRNKRPVKLMYFEEFEDRSQALKRESQIKKMQRSEKEKLLPTPASASPASASRKTSATRST